LTSRRNFLKAGILATAGLGAGLAASTLPIPGASAKKTSQAPKTTPYLVDSSSMGDVLALEQVSSAATFNVAVPTHLPAGTVLKEARVASDGNMVSLVYSSNSMDRLAYYKDGEIAMTVFQVKETVIKGPGPVLPKGFQRLSVKGNAGYAQEPDASKGQPGQVQWWSSGRRISILANQKVSELLKVANSMEAGANA